MIQWLNLMKFRRWIVVVFSQTLYYFSIIYRKSCDYVWSKIKVWPLNLSLKAAVSRLFSKRIIWVCSNQLQLSFKVAVSQSFSRNTFWVSTSQLQLSNWTVSFDISDSSSCTLVLKRRTKFNNYYSRLILNGCRKCLKQMINPPKKLYSRKTVAAFIYVVMRTHWLPDRTKVSLL